VRLLPLVIVAAGVIAYSNSFSTAFIFDDAHVIVGRPDLRHILPLEWRGRIVADLTFRINYALGGLNVADYHATNLAIHVIAGLLLFGIVRRILGEQGGAGGRRSTKVDLTAFAVAAIWVVHPLQTESVTYVCQRFESLMGLFYLLCVYAWIRAADAMQDAGYGMQDGAEGPSCIMHRASCIFWYGVCAAAFVLGMGTKEVMLTVPAVLLAYDHVFRGNAAVRALWRRRWVPVVLAAGLCLLLVPFYRGIVWYFGPGNDLLQRIPPWSYLLTQAGVILHYLRLSVVPHPLCLDYGWPLADRIGDVLLPLIVVFGLVLGTLAALVRRMPVGFLGAWFFVTLAPSSSIVPTEDAAFEHRMYLALAAVVVLGVSTLFRLAGRLLGDRRATPVKAGLTVAVVVGFTLLTLRRNTAYESEYRMWSNVAARRPNNVRAEFGVVSSLVARGEFAKAEERADRLVARIEGGDPGIGGNRVRATSGEYFYPMVLGKLGQAIAAQGRFDEAVVQYRKALGARTDDPSTYCNLAVAQYLAGRPAEAAETCRRAIRVAPRHAKSHAFLGFMLSEEGAYADALRHYEEAMRILPDSAAVQYDLAWLLATCPDESIRDGKRSVRLARRVCEATRFGSHRGLDLLAAALAENGDFDGAAETAKRALELARKAPSDLPPRDEPGRTTAAEDIEGRLRLYEQGKAFREE